jgi:hypothetical protein
MADSWAFSYIAGRHFQRASVKLIKSQSGSLSAIYTAFEEDNDDDDLMLSAETGENFVEIWGKLLLLFREIPSLRLNPCGGSAIRG